MSGSTSHPHQKYTATQGLPKEKKKGGGGVGEMKIKQCKVQYFLPLHAKKHFSCQSHTAGIKCALRPRRRETKLRKLYPLH